jgi:hypothetical protein
MIVFYIILGIECYLLINFNYNLDAQKFPAPDSQ